MSRKPRTIKRFEAISRKTGLSIPEIKLDIISGTRKHHVRSPVAAFKGDSEAVAAWAATSAAILNRVEKTGYSLATHYIDDLKALNALPPEEIEEHLGGNVRWLFITLACPMSMPEDRHPQAALALRRVVVDTCREKGAWCAWWIERARRALAWSLWDTLAVHRTGASIHIHGFVAFPQPNKLVSDGVLKQRFVSALTARLIETLPEIAIPTFGGGLRLPKRTVDVQLVVENDVKKPLSGKKMSSLWDYSLKAHTEQRTLIVKNYAESTPNHVVVKHQSEPATGLQFYKYMTLLENIQALEGAGCGIYDSVNDDEPTTFVFSKRLHRMRQLKKRRERYLQKKMGGK